MVVVECIISFFEFSGEKLVFEYIEDEESKLLKLMVKGLKEWLNLGNVEK